MPPVPSSARAQGPAQARGQGEARPRLRAAVPEAPLPRPASFSSAPASWWGRQPLAAIPHGPGWARAVASPRAPARAPRDGPTRSRLIPSRRKRHGRLRHQAGPSLAGRATALPRRVLASHPPARTRFLQRLGLRRRLEEIQARHRCGTCGEANATRHHGDHSSHDRIPPLGRHTAAYPQNATIEARQKPRNSGSHRPHRMVSV